MKKIAISSLYLLTICFLTFSSCKKSNVNQIQNPNKSNNLQNSKLLNTNFGFEKQNDNPPDKPSEVIGLIIGGIIIVIVLASGQKTQVESEDMFGNKITKTECSGIGTCASFIQSPSSDSSYGGEYFINANLCLTPDGHIALLANPVNNNINNFNSFFYSNKIKYLNPGETLTITETALLNSLNLNSPITINGGEFDVYTMNDGSKYIVLE